jgi:hypothetical protein
MRHFHFQHLAAFLAGGRQEHAVKSVVQFKTTQQKAIGARHVEQQCIPVVRRDPLLDA